MAMEPLARKVLQNESRRQVVKYYTSRGLEPREPRRRERKLPKLPRVSCRNGHVFTEKTSRVYANGRYFKRVCLICSRQASQVRRNALSAVVTNRWS